VTQLSAHEEFTAQKRVDRVKRFVSDFHANNNLVRPDPFFYEQTELANELASAISAVDSAQTSVEHAKVFDKWAVAKKEVELFHAFVECDKLIVKAKALGMIPPDADTVRKLTECEKKRAELDRRLALANQSISNLENLLRLHDIKPPRRDTLSGDVD
jgi:cell fate (sporulation/competence/biofilm development) regulator YlbF (YheA/YmcA/DUF963 family)